jgi:phage repressor protein C with HTH and peptisase S24 domain
MLISEKIKLARKLIGVSQSEASIKSGVEQKDISLLESGKKKFVPDEYIQFLYKCGIDLNTLFNPDAELRLLGANTPVANKPDHLLSDTVLTYTPADKKDLLKKNTTPNTTSNTVLTPQFITVDSEGNENILFVSVRAAAGYLNGYQDREYIETLPSFTLPQLKNGTFRAFEVDGDSMFPTLENKETVIGKYLERLENIREDYVYIVVTKDRGAVVKRLLNRIDKYGYIVAKSDALDNRNLYPNIEIYADDILEVWEAVAHINFKFKHPTDMYKRVNNIEADMSEVMRLLKKNNLLS